MIIHPVLRQAYGAFEQNVLSKIPPKAQPIWISVWWITTMHALDMSDKVMTLTKHDDPETEQKMFDASMTMLEAEVKRNAHASVETARAVKALMEEKKL